jgi:tetratricopeptide (TPR) repeat protein
MPNSSPRILALVSLVCSLVVGAPLIAATDLSEAIALTPQAGTAPEDIEISRWQEKARAPSAKVEVFERLAWAYVAKARRTLDAGYYKLAESTVSAMETRFGVSPESQLVRGHVLHNLHQFHSAEVIARKVIAERGAAEDYALLSDVLMEQGQLDASIEALQKMVNLRPGVEAYSRIAHVRWLKGDLAGAIAAMQYAERASTPRDPAVYGWLASRLSAFYLQAGQTDQALRWANAGNQAAPNFPPALLARGRVLLALGQSDAAVAALRPAAALNPLPEYQWWLADALRTAGHPDDALAVESQLKEHGPLADPRTTALFLASRGENLPEALRLAHEELANRQDVFTQDAYAWALWANGRIPEAAVAMHAALVEKTQDPRLFLHAGLIAQKAGRGDEASAFFAKALPFRRSLTPGEQTLLQANCPAATAMAQAN